MKTVEYEFTLPDGSKRYEFIDTEGPYSVITQINMFLKMWNATKARRVPKGETT